jgi:putative flippase GtrA
MHPYSPVSLPMDVFDDTTGLRNRLYWSQLIVIALVTPLSFVLNKLWTFAAVRGQRRDLVGPHG